MHVRTMLPSHRGDRPRWELSDDSGRPVAWIEAHRIGGASALFFHLTALHPATGQLVDLERSADFDERVAAAERFLREPEAFSQHWSR
jgi:hypothetical protein